MTQTVEINIKELSVFRQLFEDFYVPLCVFAQHYIDDKEDAADIVQECFVKVWQKKEDFCYLHQVKAFLYTSVRNGALNILEHRRVKADYRDEYLGKSEESFFKDQVVEEETYRILRQHIEKLPEQTRRVMLLALEGNSNTEIAELLAMTVGTVHTHKKIAYKRLRKVLSPDFYFIFLI